MAIDIIPLDQANRPLASDLLGRLAELRRNIQAIQQHADFIAHMNDGSDYTAVTTYYGVGAGQASDFAYALAVAVTEIDADGAVQTLLDKVIAAG